MCDVDSMTQMFGRIRVPEFVQEEALAVRAFRTLCSHAWRCIASNSAPPSPPLALRSSRFRYLGWPSIWERPSRPAAHCAALSTLSAAQSSRRKQDGLLFPVLGLKAPGGLLLPCVIDFKLHQLFQIVVGDIGNAGHPAAIHKNRGRFIYIQGRAQRL